jgi:hypothetical protein
MAHVKWRSVETGRRTRWALSGISVLPPGPVDTSCELPSNYNQVVWVFLLLWLLVFICSGVTGMFIMLQITDDIECNLSINARPSWRTWQVRRFPLTELRLHRKMYPASRLRTWWTIAAAINAASILIPFGGAVLRSLLRG